MNHGLLKTLTSVTLAAVVVLSGQGIVPSAHLAPSPSGCWAHSHAAAMATSSAGQPSAPTLPARDTHQCCAYGHSPALPTCSWHKLVAPSVLADVVAGPATIRSGFLSPEVVNASRAETPPAVSPLRI